MIPDQPITARERLEWALETIASATAIAAFLVTIFVWGMAL
jgi:hypothetical protein